MKAIGLGCVMLCVLAVAGVASAEDYEPGLAAHYYKDATNWFGLWPSDTDAPRSGAPVGILWPKSTCG